MKRRYHDKRTFRLPSSMRRETNTNFYLKFNSDTYTKTRTRYTKTTYSLRMRANDQTNYLASLELLIVWFIEGQLAISLHRFLVKIYAVVMKIESDPFDLEYVPLPILDIYISCIFHHLGRPLIYIYFFV